MLYVAFWAVGGHVEADMQECGSMWKQKLKSFVKNMKHVEADCCFGFLGCLLWRVIFVVNVLAKMLNPCPRLPRAAPQNQRLRQAREQENQLPCHVDGNVV